VALLARACQGRDLPRGTITPVPVRLISFPFRLDPTGSVATVEQDGDAEIGEHIALAMLTRPAERIQAPTFGVKDVAFIGFELGSLQRHLNDFGPHVEVTTVSIRKTAGDTERAEISWRRRNENREVPLQ
jgi:hypothetical protein